MLITLKPLFFTSSAIRRQKRPYRFSQHEASELMGWNEGEKQNKILLKVETEASLSTHIRGYNSVSQFWQTWEIWADLCLPERNSMTQQFNINPRHVLRGYEWWKEQNEKHQRCRDVTLGNCFLCLHPSGSLYANQTYLERKLGVCWSDLTTSRSNRFWYLLSLRQTRLSQLE